MKKVLLFVPLLLSATTLHQLFDAADSCPQAKVDRLEVKLLKSKREQTKASLFPKLSFNASLEHYNVPYNIRPLSPAQGFTIMKQGGALPFGKNIQRIGLMLSMPLFVKSIYDTKKELGYLQRSAKFKERLNLLQRKALIVGFVVKLEALRAAQEALLHKRSSIATTLKAVEVGVKNGAIAPFNSLKLQDALTKIDLGLEIIERQKSELRSNIYALTQIDAKDVKATIVGSVREGDLFALKPLKAQLSAKNIARRVQEDSYYPKIFLRSTLFKNYTKAYNNDERVDARLSSVGIFLSLDLFDAERSRQVQSATIDYQKEVNLVRSKRLELLSALRNIKESLISIQKSLTIAKRSLALKRQLRDAAKKAYRLGSMRVEEYLRYEDDLANADSTLAQLEAQKKALLAQEAFIYGIDLERIFQ